MSDLTSADARLIATWYWSALHGKLLDVPILHNPGMAHVRQRMEEIMTENPWLFQQNSSPQQYVQD